MKYKIITCGKKPNKKHLKKEKTVAIGDQIFTDVWGGKRAGCYTILVKPIDVKSENFFIKLKRIFEKPFLRKVKRGE